MRRIVLLVLFMVSALVFRPCSCLSRSVSLSALKQSVVFVSSTTIKPEDVIHPVVHKGLGPGLVYDRKGHVLVQMSSISDPHSIECSTLSKGYWPAVIVGSDPVTGICVLQIKAPDKVLSSLRPVSMAERARPGFGDHVLVIGVNPDGSRTIVPGIVSTALCPIGLKSKSVERLIQTSIFIHRGLDGAPVFNRRGAFMGMAVTTAEGPPPNMGYALPAGLVRWVADSIIKNGQVIRAYLGAEVVTVDNNLARLLNLPSEKGALVVKVEPGSPASKAGLRGCSRSLRLGNRLYPMGGDMIVAIDRIPIDSDQKLVEALNEKGPGSRVLISFYREGRLRRLHAILGRR